MSTRRAKTTTRGRDSSSGRFITAAEARRRKATATVDRIPIGRGRRKRTR